MRITSNIFIFFIDQAICQQKYFDTQFFCGQILSGIITYHDTSIWCQIQCFQNITVIFRIRLAMPGIFIGCDQFKVGRIQPCPPGPAVRCDGREQRICGENQPVTTGLQFADYLCCPGIEAAYILNFLKLVFIEGIEDGFIFTNILAIDLGEYIQNRSSLEMLPSF